MARLSKTAVAKLSQGGDAGIHWDDDLGGFGLRIYPSGVAAYVIDYRLKGSRTKRRVVLGKVAALSLSRLASARRRRKAAARRGVDLDKEQRAEVARREDEERRKANRHDRAPSRRGLPRSVRNHPVETRRAETRVVDRAVDERVAAPARRDARRDGARRPDRRPGAGRSRCDAAIEPPERLRRDQAAHRTGRAARPDKRVSRRAGRSACTARKLATGRQARARSRPSWPPPTSSLASGRWQAGPARRSLAARAHRAAPGGSRRHGVGGPRPRLGRVAAAWDQEQDRQAACRAAGALMRSNC